MHPHLIFPKNEKKGEEEEEKGGSVHGDDQSMCEGGTDLY
jgi:hypothetical protein